MEKRALQLASVASMIDQFNIPNIEILQSLGYKVDVVADFTNPGTITVERSENLKKRLAEMNVTVFDIAIPRSLNPRAISSAYKQVKELLEKEEYNLLHCHSPIGGVIARQAAKGLRRSGLKVIYTAHGFHFYDGAPIKNWLVFYPIEKHYSRYTDVLITINKEDYNRAKKKFSKRCHDIQYVPGVGIDPKKFDFKMTAKEKHDLRASLGLKDDDFVMIFPARLDKNKNQGFLIKCMPELIKENPKIHLLLPGQDELNGKYQEMAKKLNVDKKVHFLGNRDDIPKLLKISDMAVSSSKREGLPINLIEANINGLPLLLSNSRGNRDIAEKSGGAILNKYRIDEFVLYVKRAVGGGIETKKLSSFNINIIN